ncbi:MAG: FecR domain-containing protein [Myxococcales bacterium]
MTNSRNSSPPPRLSQSHPALAAQFMAAESVYHSNIDQPRAWERLQVELGRKKQGSRSSTRRLWALAALAAGMFVGWFGWDSAGFDSKWLRGADNVASSTSNNGAAAAILLAAGRSRLPDGTEVVLNDGAQGTYRKAAQRTSVEFERGRLEIAVARQPQGHHFVVKTRGIDFVVKGTRFSVKVNEPTVELEVSEGRVEVRDSDRALATVDAGGRWSNASAAVVIEPPTQDEKPEASSTAEMVPSRTAPAVAVHVATDKHQTVNSEASPSDPASCRDLLHAGKSAAAEQCYLKIATGAGLSAEMALYEVARLRRDVLANPTGALAALDEYGSRFASGTLAPEAQMARVDLLARLGRVDEALTASAQVLSTPVGRARAVELRLLRGNLLREQKYDCASAIAEYRLIAADPGPRGAQAQFGLANCLERLGRIDEAISTYRSCAERKNVKQADQARQRLKALQQ